MSGRRVLLALMLLVVAGAASGFVRLTTVSGEPAQGTCLWWASRTVPFKVNATSAATPPVGRPACPNCAPCLDSAAAAAQIAATLPTWSGATRSGEATACTDFTFVSAGTSAGVSIGKDGTNLVVVRSGKCAAGVGVPLGDACLQSADPSVCAAKYDCWEHGVGVIGLTTTSYNATTGEISDADIELYGRNGVGTSEAGSGYWLTCADAPAPACGATPWLGAEANCISTDLASLVLHEAGHVVGLDHTCVYAAPYDACPAGSVMQPTMALGFTRRALAADDVTGVCTLYPRGAATLKCPAVSTGGGKSSGGCACTSASDAGILALLCGALALLRVRRRAGYCQA